MIETERLILRPVGAQDIEDITRICQDPVIYENTLLIPKDYTRDHARHWIDTIETARAQGKAGHDFAILLKQTGRFIGVISLSPQNRHDETEAGYWLDRTHRGRGYMTEALRAVIAFAFAHGAHRVSAKHLTWNPASGRVMAKAGMTCEGIARESLKKEGRYLDDVGYAILDWEFDPSRQPAPGEPGGS